MKKSFLSLHNIKNPVIVTRHTCNINRHDNLCLFCNSSSQGIVIHLKGIRCYVYKLKRCTYMHSRACRCSICVCACDDLITCTYSQESEYRLKTRSSRAKSHSLIRAAQLSNPLLEFLSPWTCCNPATSQRISNS